MAEMMEVQWNKTETVMISNDFWKQLSCLDDRLKIIYYMVNNRSGQCAIGTIKQISNATGLSVSRVQCFLKTLEKKGVIKRKGQGVIYLPPALLPVAELYRKEK